jgi:glycosyltransferase involved in cell wall biosynthesis
MPGGSAVGAGRGPLRVLHVQKVAGISGSERHLLTLLPALARAGVQVRMVVLAAGAAADFTRALVARGVGVTVVPAGPDASPRVLRRLVREIRAFRPDVVHTHLIHADTHGQVAAWLAGVPGVSSAHSAHRFYAQLPYRTPARVAGRLARRTIAISTHVADYVTRLGLAPADRVRVVPYGVEADRWPMSATGRAQARATFAVEPDAFVVGIAARLIPHKGHALLLDAVRVLAAELPRLRVLIAGDGPLRRDVARAAAALPPGVVRLLGFVGDVRAFMNACDVLAFLTMPELNEGFGLAALEGMAAGCPVVVTRVGPLPDVVADGRAGLVVDPRSREELVRALAALAGDAGLRARLAAAARERARRTFGVDAMVDRTVDVYREVV